jgi:GT2 family glycosyltransferase
MRVAAAGKFFEHGDARFHFRGIHYDGPSRALTAPALVRSGFTVVALPPEASDFAESAAANGLRILLRQPVAPWYEVPGASRRGERAVAVEMAGRLREALRPFAGRDELLGVLLGADLPSELRQRVDVEAAFRVVAEVASRLHDIDSGLLVSAATCWPGIGCPVELDFSTVDLDTCAAQRAGGPARALSAAHSQVGDRPLVLGRVGWLAMDLASVVDLANERGAAGTLSSFTGSPTVVERLDAASVPGSSASAVEVAAAANRRTIRDLPIDWPSLTVVVCAYNAAATLEECLHHCDRLDYPSLEVLVVDDGSTDDTPEIAAAHWRVRLLRVPHVGLAAARNAGYEAAGGELVAYLDADAYPTVEWPWYLALAAAGDGVVAAGGPNVPPPTDAPSALRVALAPGGPIPQLAADDRAIHVPGCNLAVSKAALEEMHGFDPALWSAEDVEFEQRLREAGYHIGYHPAALIWHHRRPGIRPYLRQQRNYGRGQALMEHRYPERFPPGRRLRRLARVVASSAGSGEPSATVAYQTLLWRTRLVLDLVHQWGVPIAVVVATTAPFGLRRRMLAMPAAGAGAALGLLFAADTALAGAGSKLPDPQFASRLHVAVCRLGRPLAFRWGRWTEGLSLRCHARE